jgi:hypothetical protein
MVITPASAPLSRMLARACAMNPSWSSGATGRSHTRASPSFCVMLHDNAQA